jgi:hypothetical protein
VTRDEAERIVDRYTTSPAYPKPGESFGLSIVLLKARVRDRLIAKGRSLSEAYFQAERVYIRIMRDRPSFAQYQDAQRFLTPPTKPKGWLTAEEADYLAALLDRVNDPLGQSIAVKIGALTSATRSPAPDASPRTPQLPAREP